MAKRFALVSFGILCLMLAALIGFHLGSRNVEAQVQDMVLGYRVGGSQGQKQYVMLPSGDLYFRQVTSNGIAFESELFHVGNFWGGGPVPNSPSTWGNVKGMYEGEK